MREHGLLAPSRVGAPRGPRNHDGTIIPDRVNEMWGTDLTATWTNEGQAACSSPSTTARPNVSVSTPPPVRRVSRRWSQSAKVSGVTSAAFAKEVARVCPSATTTAASTCPTLPEGTRLPRHREFARLCPSAGRQRLRRALHPHPEREPALGPHLRHRRAAPPRADRVPGCLQLDLAHRQGSRMRSPW